MRPEEAVRRIYEERLLFHRDGGGELDVRLSRPALEGIARLVRPGDRTLETGAGASTVVFAACGARHTAISPAPEEHARILDVMGQLGIDASKLDLVAEPSERALRALPAEPEFDVALIDGLHGFPHPVLDWHEVARRLKVGGLLLMDDVPIPSVATVTRFMDADPAWERVDRLGWRTLAHRKLADAYDAPDPWPFQPINERWTFGHLPLSHRPYRRARLLAGRVVRRIRG